MLHDHMSNKHMNNNGRSIVDQIIYIVVVHYCWIQYLSTMNNNGSVDHHTIGSSMYDNDMEQLRIKSW